MSRSWGHAAGVLSDEQRYYTWEREPGQPVLCSRPKCSEPVSHWTRYEYVTGQAGRVSHATRKVCAGHAQRFAEKHGIDITDEPPTPTASQAMTGQFFAGGA